MTVPEEFIRVARHELEQDCGKVKACLRCLSEDQIWGRSHEIENSVGNLVLHLAGNVRQWIIAGIGGAEDDRDRAAEFARRDPVSVDELVERLSTTMREADEVLAGLDTTVLLETRKIQVYELTVLQSVYHVTQHFAGHVGQIIWATKRLTGEDLGFYRYLNADHGPPPGGLQP